MASVAWRKLTALATLFGYLPRRTRHVSLDAEHRGFLGGDGPAHGGPFSHRPQSGLHST
jgi:hypothetical protein